MKLLLVDKKWTEAHPVLSECSQLVEAYNESCSNKESLKVFFLVLQVCHYLTAGQVSSLLLIYWTPLSIRDQFPHSKNQFALGSNFSNLNIMSRLYNIRVKIEYFIHQR